MSRPVGLTVSEDGARVMPLVLVDHLPVVQAVLSIPYICLACRRRAITEVADVYSMNFAVYYDHGWAL